MLIWLLISLMLTVAYVGIMWTYKNEWEEIKETHDLREECTTRVSVIVPARNEEKYIGNILKDLLDQIYPASLVEIIVIDDFSEDNTFSIAASYSKANTTIKVLQLKDSLDKNTITEAYKKRAIEYGIAQANGTLIITTDADCRLQKHWLHSIVSFYEKEKCALIASPVGFYNDHSKFQHFQSLDFCGMQAITGASLNMKIFNMANGANLAFEKKAFDEVGGYKNIDKNASGDDMLLVYKIAQKFPDKIRFLKNKAAIVLTHPAENVQDFLQQRFRWTSKAGHYQDKRISFILLLVYLFVWSIWLNFFFVFGKIAYYRIFPNPTISALFEFLNVFLIFIILFIQILCKSLIDYTFLKSATNFFNRHDLMQSFAYSQLLHIWYIPFVGTLGLVFPYRWKGRKLK
ncbi:MAG TPA: glycosyltransferase [Chitinophagales bacterium]|nr:glycosyltransferase [Chitinophagales bacterium]HNL84195.1 glycosyltransferase [Chitinophagales bacterium]